MLLLLCVMLLVCCEAAWENHKAVRICEPKCQSCDDTSTLVDDFHSQSSARRCDSIDLRFVRDFGCVDCCYAGDYVPGADCSSFSFR